MKRPEMSGLAFSALALFMSASSQEPAPVFRSGISLIRVDIEALDSGGLTLGDLKREDFRVFDERTEQPTVDFSFEEEPLDLILLFDLSGSMRTKLLPVVRSVELGFHELKKGDRVCLMAFHSGASEVAPFTSDLEAVNQTIVLKVLTLGFGGESKPEQAAADAALRFRREPKSSRRRAVLILTDRARPPTQGAETAVRELWQSDAVLSELAIGHGPRTQILERGSTVAEKTGGATVVAGDPGRSFQQAIRLLRRRYTIYYSSPGGRRGSERSIEVRLTDEAGKRLPGSHVRSRTGYVVSGQE